MRKNTKDLANSNAEFQNIIQELVKNETVQKMKQYRQHYETSCFDHCYIAAYYCFCICKKYKLDYKSCTRSAMLHDLFLYDWRKKVDGRKGLHAFTHGKTACDNACNLFNLSKKERDIIKKHMWPVTIVPPKSIEGFILTFVDKYCALEESFTIYKHRFLNNKISRYAYVFLSLLIIRIA